MNKKMINQSVMEFAKIASVQEGEVEDFHTRVKMLSGAVAELPEDQRNALIRLLTSALFRTDPSGVLEYILGESPKSLRMSLKSTDSTKQREIALQLAKSTANLSVEAMIEGLVNSTSPSKQLLQDDAFAQLLTWALQSPLKAARLLSADSAAVIFERKADYHYVPNYFGPAYKKLSPLPSRPIFGSLASEVIATETCLLNYDRLFTLFNVLARLSETHQTNFAVIEVGVYQGGTSLFLARVLESLGLKGCSLHSCDTFEGHHSTDLIAGVDRYTSAHFVDTSEQAVCTLLSNYPFAQVHVGRIQDTYPSLPEKVGLIHLDTDLYEPTRFVLDTFYDRLIPNGAIIIDDYDTKSCPGVKNAVKEFASTHPDAFVLPMLTAQCVITKSERRV